MTFTDEDWADLTPSDKHALRSIGGSAVSFEPLRKFSMVGEKKVQSLLDKGLVEAGKTVPRNEDGFRLTEKGWLARDRCFGRRSQNDS